MIKTSSCDRTFNTSEYMTFQISYDAYIDICVDSRCSSPPTWAVHLGFREQKGHLIKTNAFEIAFKVFRKFYRLTEKVELGPNIYESNKSHVGISPNDIRMYFVIASKFDGGFPEPSVSNFRVNNQTFFSSRLHYSQLPRFTVGDGMYVDRNVYCSSLPSILWNVPLLAIQTDNRDADTERAGLIQVRQNYNYIYFAFSLSLYLSVYLNIYINIILFPICQYILFT